MTSWRRRLRALGATAILALAPLCSAVAQIDASALDEQLNTWYRGASRAAPGHWGIAVADQNGKLLWSLNPDDPLIPASTVKIFTTGFARSVLGSNARRPTRVVGAGSVDPRTGEWVGSWGLELNGDPSLERGPGAGPMLYDLALQLASSGVRKLTGPLTVLSSDGPANAIYPAAWSRHHWGRLFAPLIGPITLNENVVWVMVQPGPKPGTKPRVIGESPAGMRSLLSVTATTRRGKKSTLSLRPRADGGWVLSGTIGVNARGRQLTAVAADPKALLTVVWARALERAGINWNRSAYVGAPPTATPRVLAEVSSPPLDSLASEINRRSLNYAAELLLQWAGGREAAPARLVTHVRDVTGRQDVELADGSGLSYDDRVSPNTFIAYLARFPNTAAGRNFPQLLPANGTGTLSRLNSGFPGQGVVRAKTGTLGQVSNVVGYLGRPDGTLLVALMYNGGRPWAARQQQWKLFRVLGADGVVIPSDSFPESLVPHFGGEEADTGREIPEDGVVVPDSGAAIPDGAPASPDSGAPAPKRATGTPTPTAGTGSSTSESN
ncbi:MAG TPA: D-alanyl-D-alanine carboxypeptidase/D-alanyl-D-alanine-endopeptidase [Gemmatimonadales bacterium]|nr:D-alanyl-D-alanine carboxypeptidase/D-alanyl-D-alanine-endopeptidase [Gemmatimonadales bacterium]